MTCSSTAAFSADDSVSRSVAVATTVAAPVTPAIERVALTIVSWRRTTLAGRFTVAIP